MAQRGVVTRVLLVLICALAFVQAKELRFRADGTFKIVQFTDLHYGETLQHDLSSVGVQETVLASEDPDLTIMTGDSVSGYAWNGTAQGWFAEKWAHLTSPMIKYNATWAFACGNHDDEADLTRSEIIKLDQTYSLSLTQQGPSDIQGATNYYLFVYSSDPTIDIPVATLYFFDSGDNNCENVTGWGCVYPDQVGWYTATSASITAKFGQVIPAMAFFHIPPPEFLFMYNNLTTYGLLNDTGVCCFSVNTGLVAAFQKMGDVISIHCGHDHNNDFFGYYGDIMLAYGRKTGYGGYGPPPGWLRGARILQLSENPFKLTHWIRQEDGSVVQSTEQPVHQPFHGYWSQCCGMNGTESTNCMSYSHKFQANMNLNGLHQIEL